MDQYVLLCCFFRMATDDNNMQHSFWFSPHRVGNVFEGSAGGGQKVCTLRKELGDLDRVEKSLDQLIHSSTAQLKQLTEQEDNQRYPLHVALRGSSVVFWVWLCIEKKCPNFCCCSEP